MKTILVVDDDSTQVRLLTDRLTEKGFNVVGCTEAADGLQVAMDKDPDLIILDVMMPVINGYNFCKLLKTQKKDKNIPIIMLTSRDKKEDIEIGREMGADVYLTKPVVFEQLFDALNKFLG